VIYAPLVGIMLTRGALLLVDFEHTAYVLQRQNPTNQVGSGAVASTFFATFAFAVLLHPGLRVVAADPVFAVSVVFLRRVWRRRPCWPRRGSRTRSSVPQQGKEGQVLPEPVRRRL
jgi:hypothetical protein